MSYVVKRTDEVIEGIKRLYFQVDMGCLPGEEFEAWSATQKFATRFETAEEARCNAKNWRHGRFKVVKLVPKKAES